MNREVRDHEKITVNIDQFCCETVAVLYNDTSGNGERSVKPRCTEHSAVLLNI